MGRSKLVLGTDLLRRKFQGQEMEALRILEITDERGYVHAHILIPACMY